MSAVSLVWSRDADKSRQKALVSIRRRRQRQLAWLLYITEGHAANLDSALSNNIAELSRGEISEIRAMRKEVCLQAVRIRELLRK